MYFDRNATKNGAKRSGSGGMHRRPNAVWVLPQAVKDRPSAVAPATDSSWIVLSSSSMSSSSVALTRSTFPRSPEIRSPSASVRNSQIASMLLGPVFWSYRSCISAAPTEWRPPTGRRTCSSADANSWKSGRGFWTDLDTRPWQFHGNRPRTLACHPERTSSRPSWPESPIRLRAMHHPLDLHHVARRLINEQHPPVADTDAQRIAHSLEAARPHGRFFDGALDPAENAETRQSIQPFEVAKRPRGEPERGPQRPSSRSTSSRVCVRPALESARASLSIR